MEGRANPAGRSRPLRLVAAALVAAVTVALVELAPITGARTATAGQSAASCRPEPGLGSLVYVRGGELRVVDLATCGQRVLVASGAQPPVRFVDAGTAVEYGPHWVVPTSGGTPRRVAVSTALPAPDGKASARVVVKRLGARSAIQSIVVGGGSKSRTVYAVRTSPSSLLNALDLEMWSPDSRWLFFTLYDTPSLAADGLPLDAVSVTGGPVRRVSFGLLYGDYRAWCGDRLVITTGINRIATIDKQLMVGSGPTWRVRPLVGAPGRAWGSMTCAPDGQSVVVQAQTASSDAYFFATHWSLWRVGLDGAHAVLTQPPAGYADESPRISRDGRTLLFVRSHDGNGKLYALRNGKLTAPLLTLGYELGYYGHHDWWQTMDWSDSEPGAFATG